MRFRLRKVIAIGALTSGLIAGGALVADAATTTSTSTSAGSTSTSAGATGTSGTSGSTTPTPASSSTASSGTTKHCTDMGTGSGSRPTQGEAPETAPASG
jgi:hypothetical protein